MSVALQWDNEEKTILRWDFTGRWTTHEFAQSFQAAAMLVRSVGHSVYSVALVDGVSPPVLNGLGREIAAAWPGNLRIVIMVGASGLMKDAFARLGRLYLRERGQPRKIEFVPSLAEAYEMITYLHLKDVYGKT